MPSEQFEKAVEAAKALNGAEQWRLRDLLDIWLEPPGPVPTDEELEQEMLRDGILDHVPPPITDFTPWENRKPLELLKGKPISETLIEERR